MSRIVRMNFKFSVGAPEAEEPEETIKFNNLKYETGKHESGNYILELKHKDSEYSPGEILEISFKRKDGKEFELHQVSYDVHLPLLNFGHILVPDSGRFYMNTVLPRQVWVEHPKFVQMGRSFGNPFFALYNGEDYLEVAVGLLGDLMETEFNFYSPGANRKNSLVASGDVAKVLITKPIGEGLRVGTVKEFKDGIFLINKDHLERGKRSWYFALKAYGETYQKMRNLEHYVHENFFSPALCTWRVINSDNMDHDWVLRTVEEAAKLGIKAFIFDDGWYGVGLDSPIMYNDMGDWPIKPELRNAKGELIKYKFEDIRETVKEVQKLGVKAILWYCPISVGKDSKLLKEVEHLLAYVRDPKTGDIVKWDVGRGFYTLCPRNPEARKIMFDNLKKLIVDYGADGVKIDLFDYMPKTPCVADKLFGHRHEHDLPNTTEGVKMFFREGGKLVQQWKPGAIFSIKNNYGNVELAPFASVVRGGDSPFDENINFWRSIYPSTYKPVIHNDYLIWTRYEEPKALAMALQKQITSGVPNFTVNVLKLAQKHKEVLRAWLNFFHDRIELYKNGTFEPASEDFFSPVWVRKTDKEAMVSVLSPGREAYIPDVKTIYLMNITTEEFVYARPENAGTYKAKIFDYLLREVAEIEVEVYTGSRIPVSPAGVTVLTRK